MKYNVYKCDGCGAQSGGPDQPTPTLPYGWARVSIWGPVQVAILAGSEDNELDACPACLDRLGHALDGWTVPPEAVTPAAPVHEQVYFSADALIARNCVRYTAETPVEVSAVVTLDTLHADAVAETTAQLQSESASAVGDGDITAPPAPTAAASDDAGDPLTGHHVSWAGDRKWFFGTLREHGIADSYDLICAFCAAHDMRRPSAWGPAYRTQFLAKMARGTESRIRYDEWMGQHGETVAAETAAAKKAGK